jgi:hypothetical protein
MIDWAAKWFEVRAEMGQSDIATMMYQDQGQEFKKAHFHHRDADGFGKIVSLLKEDGIDVRAPIRPLKKPAFYWHFFLLIKGLLTHPRLPHNPWKFFSGSNIAGQPNEVSYLFLTHEENNKLKSTAQSKNLNLGFFIVSELDQIIRQRLYKNQKDKSVWLCPVDLRGAFPLAKPEQNFVSFVATEFNGMGGAAEIKKSFESYKSNLKSGSYWAFWELAHIGRWVGMNGMRWLAKQATNRAFWMGSFSDLGIWNQPEIQNSKACDRYWVIAPPGSPAYPIGITTIEWCGNRSITMKIHPAICERRCQALSDEILGEFKTKLLN